MLEVVRDELRDEALTALLLPALEQYHSVSEPTGPPVHDVCAVAWVAEPDLFGLVPARVQVEVAGQFTAGMTVTDFDFPGEVGSGHASPSFMSPPFCTSKFHATVTALYTLAPGTQGEGGDLDHEHASE